MKVWHDDIRRPPDETWEWARTNEVAQELLIGGEVTEISLDHDLGLENESPDDLEACFQAGPRPEDIELVKWMCAVGCVPSLIVIHSWNPDGAKRMAALFNDYGHNALVRPFVYKEVT